VRRFSKLRAKQQARFTTAPGFGEELFAGSFGCGNDFVEARVTALWHITSKPTVQQLAAALRHHRLYASKR
jgi:hypothetical protein